MIKKVFLKYLDRALAALVCLPPEVAEAVGFKFKGLGWLFELVRPLPYTLHAPLAAARRSKKDLTTYYAGDILFAQVFHFL
ncbi:hypothetical protein [Thermodesulforhabdus norvegica]|uniref:Uncharacterized protein n=1 Tax=Thermodesulforhabdus norvegica TaxID=39841 RepID=A0A1I4VEV3_9BACT|nr:hypothetical protein [Thermodesulforhabdus norvegica]SFM99754.1 hypothetical protein SAMN05660836_02264 [Thermodesulforhabdus norvegica]